MFLNWDSLQCQPQFSGVHCGSGYFASRGKIILNVLNAILPTGKIVLNVLNSPKCYFASRALVVYLSYRYVLTHRIFWCISIRSTVLFLEKQQLEELPIQNKHTKKLGHFLLQMHLMGRLMLIFWLLFSVLIWAECRKENVSDLIWLSISSLLDILSLWTPLKKNTSQQ